MNFSTLIGGLSELGSIKNHLLRAGKEILLAIQDLLSLADQYSSSAVKTGRPLAIQQVIRTAQGILRTLTEKLPKQNEDMMNSILSVLEKEIRKTAKSKDPKSKMKTEVLQAIRNVFLKQTDEQENESL